MAEIISINGFVNYEIKNNKLRKVIRIYEDNFELVKGELFSLINSKNYAFLIRNYNTLNQKFNTLPEDKKTEIFSNLIIDSTENLKDPMDKVLNILFYYNAYRIYGEKITELSSDDIQILLSLFMSYEGDFPLTDLDNLFNFIFDKDIKKKLYDTGLENKNITHLLESATDSYFLDQMEAKRPLNYFIKEEIDNYNNNKFRVLKSVSLDTPENIYEHLKLQSEILINILLNSENEEQRNLGNYFLNSLDTFVIKVKNIPEEQYDICINNIANLLQDNSIPLLDKLKTIYNYVDQNTSLKLKIV